MLTWIESTLAPYTQSLSIELFAFVASFVEEVIPPIPGPAIMMMAGGFAAMQEYTLPSLFLLAIFAAAGKSLGAIIVYHLVGHVEDFLVSRFGKFFGIKSGDLENFGAKLGKGTRDYIVLTILRSLPFVPSSLVSVGCGLLKVPFRMFMVATVIGTIVRDSIFLYVGYAGATALKMYLEQSESIGTTLKVIALIGIISVLAHLYLRERKRSKNKTTSPDSDVVN